MVITGVGALSAAGPTALDLWAALLAGRVGPTPLRAFAPGRPAVAAQIADYTGPAAVPPAFAARLSRSDRFALDAAIQAISDARIGFTAENAFQVAAVVGTAHPSGEQPFSSGLAGAVTGLKIAGPTYSVSADGASGLIAIAQAAALIQAGTVQVAVAGGAEAPLTPALWKAYDDDGLLSRGAEADAQRPFDRARDGLVLGEGAAMLVLESLEVAMERGVRIYAEVAGWGQTAGPFGDGHPPTDVDIARRALGDALRQAGLRPHGIDVIYAAGAGTVAGDRRETDALERAFGSKVLDMYVTTVTPVVGYAAGAAGALSAAAAAFSLTEQTVPPHAGYHDPDPDCALDFSRAPQHDHLNAAAVCAYGAGGQNAALVLLAYRGRGGVAGA